MSYAYIDANSMTEVYYYSLKIGVLNKTSVRMRSRGTKEVAAVYHYFALVRARQHCILPNTVETGSLFTALFFFQSLLMKIFLDLGHHIIV